MISRLTGKIIDREPPTLVLDVNGVGYEVDVPMTTLFELPEHANKPVTLYTHFIVREDAQQLYGFIDQNNRDIFRQLLKVNGVGARTALGILSTFNVNDLVSCILNGEADQLVKVPGIGKKSAERIVLDLRDRLKDWDVKLNISASSLDGAAGVKISSRHVGVSSHQDAVSALIALGYKAADAEKAVKKVAVVELSSEEVIRLALKSIAA